MKEEENDRTFLFFFCFFFVSYLTHNGIVEALFGHNLVVNGSQSPRGVQVKKKIFFF